MKGNNKNLKNTKVASFFHLIKELWKDPLGKCILFFGFYLIFFIFLGVLYRTAPRTSTKRNLTIPSQTEKKVNISFDKLLEGNYEFTYEENVRGVQKIYTGKSSEKRKELTTSLGQKYFLYSGISIEQQENVWKVCENPFHYPQLMNETYIEDVFSKATFESKTVYHNNETLYRYQISTTTLWEIYQKEQIDIADVPNTIELTLSENGEIKKIYYDFSSYETYLLKVPSTAIFEVGYQNYGTVGTLEIPA